MDPTDIRDAIAAMEGRLNNRIDAVRLEIAELREDLAGLSRELVEANDLSVRDAEARILARLAKDPGQ
jgi:hypothetical protein